MSRSTFKSTNIAKLALLLQETASYLSDLAQSGESIDEGYVADIISRKDTLLKECYPNYIP